MVVWKFIAKIMIHHQVAFSPKYPDSNLPRATAPASPNVPPLIYRNAPDAIGSISPHPEQFLMLKDHLHRLKRKRLLRHSCKA
jgi:hypothetical protein